MHRTDGELTSTQLMQARATKSVQKPDFIMLNYMLEFMMSFFLLKEG